MSLPLLTRLSDDTVLSQRAPPTTHDGRYDYETAQNPYLTAKASHSSFSNFMRKITSVSDKTLPANFIDGFIDQALHPTAVDDRKLAFANGLGFLSAAPPDSDLARELSIKGVTTLYNTVPHPPVAFLGSDHVFRAADGGGNCLEDADRGRAGLGYARSVQTKFAQPRTALPDPGLIFDTLLKRRGIVDHPGGTSAFTFAYATLVTHSIFMTDPSDWSRNKTSSYLDLSPLYGHNQKAQDQIRDKKSGRGLIYPDTYAEYRLTFLPPAASALLVVFSRNHNYIAERLLKINERGTWSDPPLPDKLVRQDEEIFQTARLINSGHFMSMIIGDYAAGFLGLSEGQFWDIPAFDEMRLSDGSKLERGRGNHVSVEFNLLYRWHATISEADEKWTEQQLSAVFKKPFRDITLEDFKVGMMRLKPEVDKDPRERTFGGLTRDENGRFPDDEVARILLDATQTPGGAWRARGTPEALRIVEILGIEQARQWGVCTMNEFREFLGLKQFESFEEWNSNPAIADAARQLYGHISHLELYAGLQAEETMPLTPGSRIAAGFTTVRAVLGDAIAMVRGDRHYTTDFTPANLTAWGYQDCMRDPNNGGFGGQMPKLLRRVLPRHYPHNSVYALFPYFTPRKMEQALAEQKRASHYVFERPPTPSPVHVISTRAGILAVSGTTPGTPTGADTAATNGEPANGDNTAVARSAFTRFWRRSSVRSSARSVDNAWALRVMFPPNRDALTQYRRWFRDAVDRNIRARSWEYDGVPGRYVDIVVGVINATSVEWAAEHLCGISLKTTEHPRGLYTEQQVYDKFSLLFKSMFLSEKEPENAFSLLFRANEEKKLLARLVADAIVDIKPEASPTILSNLVGSIANMLWKTQRRKYQDFLGLLASDDDPLDTLTAAALGMAVCSAMNVIQTAVLVIDFYLDNKRKSEREKIIALVSVEGSDNDELLIGYVREAMRLNPAVGGLYVTATEDVPADGVRRGDRIWASYKNAQLNAADFPNPEQVNPRRPGDRYLPTPTYFMGCPGPAFVEQIVAEFVRAVFLLRGVRRAHGFAGELVRFSTTANETDENWYITPSGATDAFPGTMHLVYDV